MKTAKLPKSEELLKELTGFFEAKDFLSE